MQALEIETPRAFIPLLEPARYKGAYGGRGGAKSHFFAESLIERCYMQPTRAVCIREVQNSLKESVRQLLVDKIAKLGLGWFFEVLEAEIRGLNGSLIIFKGMQSYNAESIKSLEGYDIAWVEEAQALSDRSLRLLRPTIRKSGSELWFSWNPRHDTDPVDILFRGGNPPKGAVAVEVCWRDNPWFPVELRDEMERDYAADPEMAEHVWGGGYEIITEGAYYARDIAALEKSGRIGEFPHDPSRKVSTAWDIGVDDYTAIWFFQEDGIEVRAIDYYETSGDGAELIVNDAIKSKSYDYDAHYFPHDVKVREWGKGAKSRLETLIELGIPSRTLRVGAAQKPEERINAARRLLPICSFNKETTERGVKRLRNYRRRYNEVLQTFQGPLHDENSHGSDAFGEYAVNCPIIAPDPPAKKPSIEERFAPRTFDQVRKQQVKRHRHNSRRII